MKRLSGTRKTGPLSPVAVVAQSCPGRARPPIRIVRLGEPFEEVEADRQPCGVETGDLRDLPLVLEEPGGRKLRGHFQERVHLGGVETGGVNRPLQRPLAVPGVLDRVEREASLGPVELDPADLLRVEREDVVVVPFRVENFDRLRAESEDQRVVVDLRVPGVRLTGDEATDEQGVVLEIDGPRDSDLALAGRRPSRSSGRFDQVSVRAGDFRPYFSRSSAFSVTSVSARSRERSLRSRPTDGASAGAATGSTIHQPRGAFFERVELEDGRVERGLPPHAGELQPLDLVGRPGEDLAVAEGELAPGQEAVDRVGQAQDGRVAWEPGIERLSGERRADRTGASGQALGSGRPRPSRRVARVAGLPELEDKGRLVEARVGARSGVSR